MVRGRRGERDKISVVEHRHHESDIGAVAGAGIGVVVHDHIARPHRVAARCQRLQDAADIARDRPRLQRRRLRRLGEAPTLGIDQRRAEILRFADNRRIRHPHQLVAHLDRDVFERALDDARGDAVDGLRPYRYPSNRKIKLPLASALAVASGGTTVVELVCRMIAGPAIGCRAAAPRAGRTASPASPIRHRRERRRARS